MKTSKIQISGQNSEEICKENFSQQDADYTVNRSSNENRSHARSCASELSAASLKSALWLVDLVRYDNLIGWLFEVSELRKSFSGILCGIATLEM